MASTQAGDLELSVYINGHPDAEKFVSRSAKDLGDLQALAAALGRLTDSLGKKLQEYKRRFGGYVILTTDKNAAGLTTTILKNRRMFDHSPLLVHHPDPLGYMGSR